MGNVDEKGKALVECTKETLEKSIAICGPGVPYKEIGRVIWYTTTAFILGIFVNSSFFLVSMQ